MLFRSGPESARPHPRGSDRLGGAIQAGHHGDPRDAAGDHREADSRDESPHGGHGAHEREDNGGEGDYRVDPLQTDAFVEAIRDLEPIRRRDGAVRWAVYQDPGQNGRYVESFIVESWLEHLRQHERATVGDRAVQERIRQFHIAGAPPSVTHLITAKFGRP